MWARIEPLLPVRRTKRARWDGMTARLAVAAGIGVLMAAAFTAGRVAAAGRGIFRTCRQ